MPDLPRIHLALGVADLAKSLAFYRALLGVEPTKEKPGYAKLESAAPSINLALNETKNLTEIRTPMHFGVEVDSTEKVAAAHDRMRAAGFETENEEGVTCCFAVQDKVWIEDPDGHRWEVYVRHADADVHSLPSTKTADAACCEGATAKAQTPCCEPASPAPGCCA